MRSLTRYKVVAVLLLSMVSLTVKAEFVQLNAFEIANSALLNSEIVRAVNKQTEKEFEIAVLQGGIAAVFHKTGKWESEYNDYLKDISGFASSLKAGSNIYLEGVMALRNLLSIRKAIEMNPTGVGATLVMSNIYIEAVMQFVKTFKMMKTAVAQGGSRNMLTGSERAETLWTISDNLSKLNRDLRMLAVNIAIYNSVDVFDWITRGLTGRSHGSIARECQRRWSEIPRARWALANV